MTLPRLHVVTDDEVLAAADFEVRAGALLARGGASLALHLRGHDTGAERLTELAERLAPRAHDAGALLIVNDRLDVALGCGAGGVHLGARSIPVAAARRLLGDGRTLGYSAHAADEAAAAFSQGADYVFLGPVYETASHPGSAAIGVDPLRQARTGGRVVAIGGMTPRRTPEVLDAGAHGVAAVRAIWNEADAAAAAERFIEALER